MDWDFCLNYQGILQYNYCMLVQGNKLTQWSHSCSQIQIYHVPPFSTDKHTILSLNLFFFSRKSCVSHTGNLFFDTAQAYSHLKEFSVFSYYSVIIKRGDCKKWITKPGEYSVDPVWFSVGSHQSLTTTEHKITLGIFIKYKINIPSQLFIFK